MIYVLYGENDILIDKYIKNIIKEKPSFEVYFDRDRKKTWATIKAIYGNVNFNILKNRIYNNEIILNS